MLEFPKLPYGTCRLYSSCPDQSASAKIRCGRSDYWNCPGFTKVALFPVPVKDLVAWDKLLNQAFGTNARITYCVYLDDTCARADKHPACKQQGVFCDHSVEIAVKESLERITSK